MTPTSYAFGIAAAATSLIVVIELLRRRRLRERHAAWWLLAGVLSKIIGIFPATLVGAASLLGIEVPSNLVFFVSIGILFFVSLQHSTEVTVLESKSRDLAERSALLELRIREVEERPCQRDHA